MPQRTLPALARAAAAALLAVTAAAWAQGGSGGTSGGGLTPAETQALHNYVLSMDKLQKYAAASDELKKTVRTDTALAAEIKQMSDEPEETLADLRARITRHPTVLAYFTRQGLSTDDVLLLPMTLMGASLATSIKDPAKYPPSINPEQVKFVAAHKEEIDKLHLVSDDEDELGN